MIVSLQFWLSHYDCVLFFALILPLPLCERLEGLAWISLKVKRTNIVVSSNSTKKYQNLCQTEFFNILSSKLFFSSDFLFLSYEFYFNISITNSLFRDCVSAILIISLWLHPLFCPHTAPAPLWKIGGTRMNILKSEKNKHCCLHCSL